jgi:hypothetical protein
MTLEFAQKSRELPNKVEIRLMKEAGNRFIPGMNKRYEIAAAKKISSPYEKQPCDHKQVTGRKKVTVKKGRLQVCC